MAAETSRPPPPDQMLTAGEAPSAPPAEVKIKPQPPEDEKIKFEVRKLELYIAEHVREYYDRNKDGDHDGIFGFKPLKGLGVEVAIRRFIALHALDILKPDEYLPSSIDAKVRQIHGALANYRLSGNEDACKDHLWAVLQLAVDLEKLLRASTWKWDFGSLELRKPKRIDVVAFPSFLKGGNLILPESRETVRVHPNDATWARKCIRATATKATKATKNMLRPGRQSGGNQPPLPEHLQEPVGEYQDPAAYFAPREEYPVPLGAFPRKRTLPYPESPVVPLANLHPESNPPDQADIPWRQPKDPRYMAPLLLLDLVIYLLCLIRLTLEGSVGRPGVSEPGNISVPPVEPRLPSYFETFGGRISELVRGEEAEITQLETS